MANLVLKPQVTAFLDAVTTAAGPDLQLAEIEVRQTCAAAGRSIRELRIRHETGAIVIALRKEDGTFDTTPEPDTPIEVGDVLIGVGSPDEIRSLEDLFADDRILEERTRTAAVRIARLNQHGLAGTNCTHGFADRCKTGIADVLKLACKIRVV